MRDRGVRPAAAVAALVAALAVVTVHGPARAADPLSAKTGELEKLKSRIQALRHDLEAEQGRKDTLRGQLRDIEKRIGTLSLALKKTSRELRRQQHRLAELNRDKARHQAELDRQRDRLAQQVRAAYGIGRQGYLKLLLNQQDPSAVSRNLVYYDYFNRARVARITAVSTELDHIKTLERDIARQMQTLDQLNERRRREQDSLRGQRRARGLVLAKVNARIETKDQELARLLDNQHQLESVIQRLRNVLSDIPEGVDIQPFDRLKGRLRWPVQGTVVRHFGAPRQLGKLKWQGVLIGARPGTDVHAVYHGRVAFADWLRGYGLLVIIDHGNGYMSLYGHNQSISKEAGDWVETGEVIATVGNSGGNDRPGLYFEIRHNGVPRNPVLWCKK